MTEKDFDKKAEAAAEVGEEDSFIIDEDFFNSVKDLVPTTDDVDMPSLTFRVWFLGTIFCVALSYINMIFSFRTNPFTLTSFVVTLLSYPMGKFMARVLPSTSLFGMNLNPGPFTIKEHILIGIFGSTGSSSIYAMYNLTTQEVMYDLQLGIFWDIAFLMASACMGFGLAGLFRRFVIRPAHMVWPNVLPSVALYSAFHKVETEGTKDDGKKHWSGLKMFFVTFFIFGFLHVIGPGYASNMLSYIPLLCWFTPSSNKTMQQLGSPMWGPGVLSFTLDLSAVGSGPMVVPFWTTVNSLVSFIGFAWIAAPLLHYNNVFNQPKFPKGRGLNTTRLFDNSSKPFAGAQVMTKNAEGRIVLNKAVFDSRKPIHFTTFFGMAYFGHMASLTAAIMHTALWYGKDIVSRLRAAKQDKDDIHCKLMDKYPDISDNVYLGFLVLTAVLLVGVAAFSPLGMPIWSVLLAFVMAVAGAIPMVFLRATTGAWLGLNVISQFVIGLILPGEPIVMMGFKCICFAVSFQVIDLLLDLKLAHYMKVNPRHVFIVQVYSQIIACFVNYAAFRYWVSSDERRKWIVANGTVAGVGKDWGGQNTNVYYAASLIWGAIGAKRFFFETQYAPVIWVGVLTGLILPVILWGCYKIFGGLYWQLIHPAILLGPASPGSNNAVYLTSLIMGGLSQWYLYRYKQAWWKRYNYIVATGLEAGIAIFVMVLNTFPEEWRMPNWFLNCNGIDDCEAFQGNHGVPDWCFPN